MGISRLGLDSETSSRLGLDNETYQQVGTMQRIYNYTVVVIKNVHLQPFGHTDNEEYD